MPKASPAITSFTGGEFSPLIEGRVDYQKYTSGAHTLENFICTVQGPIRRRPGTRFAAEVKNSANKTYLTRFVFKVGQSYILEWGDHYVRFYTNHGYVLGAGPGSVVFSSIIGNTTVDGALTWTCRGMPDWHTRAGTLHEIVIDPSGKLQTCISAGATGFPLWNSSTGGITIDGSAVWQCLGLPVWAALTAFAAFAAIYTPQGVQQVTAGGGGLSGNGIPVPYEIPTPYGVADLTDENGFFALRYAQVADVVRFANTLKTFPPYKLSRFAPANWTIAPMAQTGGPFKAINPKPNPIVFASDQKGAGITLTASDNIFDPLYVDSLFYLERKSVRDIKPWETGKQITKGDLRRNNGITYMAMNGIGDATTVTGTVPPTHTDGQAYDGSAGGNILWRYEDPGYGWGTIRSVGAAPAGTTNPITAATAANPVVITSTAHGRANGDLIFITGVVGMTDINDQWFSCAGVTANTINLQTLNTAGALINLNGTQFSAYVSGGTIDPRKWTAIVDVVADAAGRINQFPAEVTKFAAATSKWAIAAWNNKDGWPSQIAFFRQRLTLARDQDIRTSVSADFENFNAKDPGGQVTADYGISITLPSQDPIQWLTEGTDLLAGTSGAEHVIGEINAAQALGPANVRTTSQLAYGSRQIPPVRIDKSILFVQTSGRKLREITFDLLYQTYSAGDITKLAEHISQSGFAGMAFTQEPDLTLWAHRTDGQLVALTFSKEEQVQGWQRHPLGGNGFVESMVDVPSPDGSRNELWMIVRRTINGQTKRYVEFLEKHYETGDDQADAFYVDCGLTYSGAPTSTISGLGHLEGETVNVRVDGAEHPQRVVSGGQITLARAASKVQVGLPQSYKWTSMRIEAGAADGTAQGKTKRITNVTIRVKDSLGGRIGTDGDIMDPLTFRTPPDPMGAAVPLYTGDYPPSGAMSFPETKFTDDRAARITIAGSDTSPFTLVGVWPQLETQDR